jgi:hypothetical protein
MAPFSYTPYTNPFAGTIGELMQRGPEQQAEALRQIGDARARAASQSGAAWAGAAQGIGASVSGALRDYADPRRQLEAAQLKAVTMQNAGTAALHTGQQKVDTMMAGDQLPAGDAGPRAPSYLDANGMFDVPKMNAALAQSGSAHLAPELLKGAEAINQSITNHQALLQKTGQAQTLLFGDMAHGALTLAKVGMPLLNAMDFVVQPALATKSIDPDQYQQVRSRIAAMPPDQQAAALNTFRDAAAKLAPTKTLAEGGIEVDRYDRTIAANPKVEKDTEASIALKAAGGDPVLAMHLLKPDANAKPGTVEDWVSRARRLAVAQNKGAPLTDAQLQTVDTKAMQDFKETNADPELRAAALAQKNIAASLARMQLDQQPTPEQAAAVAEDLVNHRQSPAQVKAMFGTRGVAGQSFMLNVAAAAKKLDPSFNFEEAEAGYTLSKSTGFQNTVRYMDSTLESMPQLLKNAQALDNGNVRSINALVNAGKNQFNSIDLKKFKTDALLVGDEVAKILSGGGTGSATSDAKLKQGVDLLSSTDSPSAIAATLTEIQSLIGNRRRALTRGTYMENSAAATPGAGLISVTDPLGGVHSFSSQADADKFKKAAGIR